MVPGEVLGMAALTWFGSSGASGSKKEHSGLGSREPHQLK